EGVLVDTGDLELEVQVRPGGSAGGAHGTDEVALLDLLTLAHVDAAEVGVGGGGAVAVLDFDDVAVATLPACERDHAVSDRAHAGAGGGGEINPQVGLAPARNRVKPHAVAAADTGELQRRTQEL